MEGRVAATQANYPSLSVIGTPQLGDYLEEGLAALGISLESFEIGRLLVSSNSAARLRARSPAPQSADYS